MTSAAGTRVLHCACAARWSRQPIGRDQIGRPRGQGTTRAATHFADSVGPSHTGQQTELPPHFEGRQRKKDANHSGRGRCCDGKKTEIEGAFCHSARRGDRTNRAKRQGSAATPLLAIACSFIPQTDRANTRSATQPTADAWRNFQARQPLHEIGSSV